MKDITNKKKIIIAIIVVILLFPFGKIGSSSGIGISSLTYEVMYYDAESVYCDMEGVKISILGFKIYDNTR